MPPAVRVRVGLKPRRPESSGPSLDSQETAGPFELAREAFAREVEANQRRRERARASAERSICGLPLGPGFEKVHFVERLPLDRGGPFPKTRRNAMRAVRGWMAATALLAGLLLPGESRAASVKLGLGANYWVDREGLFNLDLGVRTALARHLIVGGRFGAFLTTGEKVGIPVDLTLTIPVAKGRVYLEGLAGPWFAFEGDLVRAHAAFGFGLQSGGLSAGIEAGWLAPSGIIGARVAFAL